jgi:hypothetical protein
MMRNDSDVILDDLLQSWHRWMQGFQLCPQAGADPMFRHAKSGRGWDSTQDIIDEELSDSTMEAIDFAVSGDKTGLGGLPEPYRSAVYAHARNLSARVAVWGSPRLPQDPLERARLIGEARTMLTARLLRAGVI